MRGVAGCGVGAPGTAVQGNCAYYVGVGGGSGQGFADGAQRDGCDQFSLRGINGRIDASISGNDDPAELGYLIMSYGLPVDFARGFPVCRASVTYPADGYAAIFGWTQMVRSTDAAT